MVIIFVRISDECWTGYFVDYIVVNVSYKLSLWSWTKTFVSCSLFYHTFVILKIIIKYEN